MPDPSPASSRRVWTIAETKARLSEILRLAETEGPQRIGARRPFIVIPERLWKERESPAMPMGRWMIENLPREFDDLELPDRNEPERPNPFLDSDDG